jgi:hypothetical protein
MRRRAAGGERRARLTCTTKYICVHICVYAAVHARMYAYVCAHAQNAFQRARAPGRVCACARRRRQRERRAVQGGDLHLGMTVLMYIAI